MIKYKKILLFLLATFALMAIGYAQTDPGMPRLSPVDREIFYAIGAVIRLVIAILVLIYLSRIASSLNTIAKNLSNPKS